MKIVFKNEIQMLKEVKTEVIRHQKNHTSWNNKGSSTDGGRIISDEHMQIAEE